MTKKLILSIFLFTLMSASCYALDVVINANVVPVEALTIKSVSVPANYNSITAAGDYSGNITSACWSVVDPITVYADVTNNSTTKELIIFTKHRNESYWTGNNATSLPTSVTINGLINTAIITTANYAQATVPLRAYADVWGTGIIPTADSSWGCWITDLSNAPANDYTLASHLYQGILSTQNMLIYIKSSWNAGKIAGNYNAKIILGITTQ